MILALLSAGVAIAVVLMARSARRARKDRHSLRAYHRVLDTLGDVAHVQDSATPPGPDPASVRAHVRVIAGGLPVLGDEGHGDDRRRFEAATDVQLDGGVVVDPGGH